MAKQANGAVVVRMGDTMSLMTITADRNPSDRDFLPLFVEYRNKTYAAGKIPGGFFKREARPTERETLSARLIDRPLRPLFPDGYRHETQVVAFIISADTDFHADTLSITGASAALNLSDVPFTEYVSAVRVAEVEGNFIPNPSLEQLEESSMDLVVAGTDDIVCMIEGECEEVGEDRLLDAIEFAHEWIRKLNGLQRELVAKAGAKPKWEPVIAPKKDRPGRPGGRAGQRRAQGRHRGQGQDGARRRPEGRQGQGQGRSSPPRTARPSRRRWKPWPSSRRSSCAR